MLSTFDIHLFHFMLGNIIYNFIIVLYFNNIITIGRSDAIFTTRVRFNL